MGFERRFERRFERCFERCFDKRFALRLAGRSGKFLCWLSSFLGRLLGLLLFHRVD